MSKLEKGKLELISKDPGTDFTAVPMGKNLSTVGFESDEKYFYMTVDKLLFSDPVTVIKTVLEAHGFVPNLENILSCLDSFVFSAYSRVSNKNEQTSSYDKVHEYLPCIRFELPQKNKVGETLQSFYDVITNFESTNADQKTKNLLSNRDAKRIQELKTEVNSLKEHNKELKEQVSILTYQLSQEQKSLDRASKALDSQRILPDNARLCRVESVDLKLRKVKVKCHKKSIDIPTHMLDRVPDFQERCLITFNEGEQVPLGIIFFSKEELGNLEKRTAELLYVTDDSFKARDSFRNEFQIKAVNPLEAETIQKLKRGMKVVISISDGYVVQFSVLDSVNPLQFQTKVHEQYIVFDIAKNQLVTVDTAEDRDN